MVELEVAWDELLAAFQSAQEGPTCYLDCSSGHVVTKAAAPASDVRLVEVPRLSPRDSYDDMRRFLGTVRSVSLRERLHVAIQGRGAFRRFRAALSDSPREQQQWFAFRERAARERLLRWLAAEGVEPLNPGPGPVALEPDAEREPEPDPATQLEDLTLALLYLSSWEERRPSRGVVRRAWKGYRFEVLDRLAAQGLVTLGRSSKSVFFTPDGIARAVELEERLRRLSLPRAGQSASGPERPRTPSGSRPRRDPARRYR